MEVKKSLDLIVVLFAAISVRRSRCPLPKPGFLDARDDWILNYLSEYVILPSALQVLVV